jgi:Stage II sporulation protein E (SpoIIE)
VTALLCDMDLATGLLTWIPCGHPPPLLIRGQTVKELARTARPPLGLGDVHARRGKRAHDVAVSAPLRAERLEPRDRVLLYTGGVTEGRAADGTPSACNAWLTSSSGTTARSCLHPRPCVGSTARSSSTSRAAYATTQPPS